MSAHPFFNFCGNCQQVSNASLALTPLRPMERNVGVFAGSSPPHEAAGNSQSARAGAINLIPSIIMIRSVRYVIGALAILALFGLALSQFLSIPQTAKQTLLVLAAGACAFYGLEMFPRNASKRPIVKRKLLFGASLTLFAGAALLLLNCFECHSVLAWLAHHIAPGGTCLAIGGVMLTEEQMAEFKQIIGNMGASWSDIKNLLKEFPDIRSAVRSLQRSRLSQGSVGQFGTRPKGRISDDAAAALGASFVLHVARKGGPDVFGHNNHHRDATITEARSILNIQQRAESTAEIPLPTAYTGQLTELIADFGVVRKDMMSYPIPMGTAKPPRMGTRPAFESIAMSAAFPEKKPTVTFASLESHKIGGIVQMPREIMEQSIVPMGQYLAMYGAVEFARAEDTWGFLADGSATYEQVKGVGQICRDNNKTLVLAAGKTKPSDATLDNFRNLRAKVNVAALSGGKYYCSQTNEQAFRSFNTIGSPAIFDYRPDGVATLDGFPIVWTEVLQPYITTAAANTIIAAFGNLRFYWFGEHGSPRIDSSQDVYFANDQIGVRFIEEIDFDYNALDSMACLITAAN
jgi:HK97 family phage major capsid protein